MRDIAAQLWAMLDGDPALLDRVRLEGPPRLLPSVFDVTGLATASVGVATLAAAELQAARCGGAVDPVAVTTAEASAAFRCETLLAPDGWKLPPIWDSVAGDHRAADGWIRLHTNYAHHRAAAMRALGIDAADREIVTVEVARWTSTALESRVVDEGGVAAAMHTREEWLAHPHGSATAAEPPVDLTDVTGGGPCRFRAADRPLADVKVLDLTRVIAGPFATRFLAAWGADVLRLDPPGFAEVPALVPEATAGKHCAFLDLSTEGGRRRFVDLVCRADVLVHGYRPGALDALGLDHDALRAENPKLIISQHNAYGWTGPWAHRRGFDSLVQMSCGIAAAQGPDRPRPLPAQALDHATAMHIAAAVCRALTERTRSGRVVDIRGSLIGAANLLFTLPDEPVEPDAAHAAPDTEARLTWWGPAWAVPVPGRIGGQRPRLDVEPGPLGRHEPRFMSR